MTAEEKDVLVIGGGTVGLNAAYYLHKAGRDVTVLERDSSGEGCSFGNAGLICPSHLVPLPAPGVIAQGLKWMFDGSSPFYIRPRLSVALVRWLWQFRKHCTQAHVDRSIPVLANLLETSRGLTEKIAGDEKLDFGLDRRGLLMLFHEEEERETTRLAEAAARVGMEAKFLHDPEGVKNLDPGLDIVRGGGLHFPGDSRIDPRRYMQELARHLEGNGVEIRRGEEVTRIEREGNRIREIGTERNSYRPREVVLAAGSWSPLLARRLKLRIPVQPGKGYSVTFPKPEGCFSIPLILTEARVAVTPFENELRFAGTMEFAGWDLRLRPKRIRAILDAVPRYLRGIRIPDMKEAKVWAGLRPCSADGLPIIDRAPGVENLVIATGHSMLGIALSSVTGHLVADIVEKRDPIVDLVPVRLGRFKGKTMGTA